MSYISKEDARQIFREKCSERGLKLSTMDVVTCGNFVLLYGLNVNGSVHVTINSDQLEMRKVVAHARNVAQALAERRWQ
jgi:hypothetical protein